jgi:hypothetical protein
MSTSNNLSSPAFIPEPSGRGTIGLVTSCVLTTSLCVWSVIHMTVYRSGLSWWHRFLKKLKIAVIAFTFPESLLEIALSQLQSAQILHSQRNATEPVVDMSHDPHTDCSVAAFQRDEKSEMWTLEHGYFAAMGGFELIINKMQVGRRIHLDDVIQLAIQNMLPPLKDKIEARSKSNSFGKALACMQASWMVIQTIARAVAGLPVTLLELNTVAHVGCTIVLYGVWWYKLQDVEEPITIDVTGCAPCTGFV